MNSPAAAEQLPLPGMGGTAGFYEAHTDRVRCAGRPAPAGTPIPEADCGDLQPSGSPHLGNRTRWRSTTR